jgi:tetratricopeptide (TPR) repeat protein
MALTGILNADSFMPWFAKAEKAQRRKDDETALQAWSNALHLWKPSDGKTKKAHALSERAALYEKKGEWEAAMADLCVAIKISSKDAALFHRRGRLYLEHEKTADAISDFYKATALKLDYAEAFFDRGRAYDAQGDARFAHEDYQTACRLGLKPACDKIKAVKRPANKKPAKPALASVTLPPKSAPKPVAEEIPAAPATDDGSSASPDWKACIARVSACAKKGSSYGECVARAKICENSPMEGCCPRGCVALFKKLVDDSSEAEAFREVFTPGNPCALSVPSEPE